MCLSIPAKIVTINGDMATVSLGETIINASLQLVDDIKVGDYILLHTGFAIQKLSQKEAEETFKLFEELGRLE
ncbi:MAG: HypC/HybG/HupF family hydrogenase formation chaperone [Bacteroidetes bacterium]|nr:HypC/HybG/HupF family hydrogenase formation chaperone [Bacteroidota bacterium]